MANLSTHWWNINLPCWKWAVMIYCVNKSQEAWRRWKPLLLNASLATTGKLLLDTWLVIAASECFFVPQPPWHSCSNLSVGRMVLQVSTDKPVSIIYSPVPFYLCIRFLRHTVLSCFLVVFSVACLNDQNYLSIYISPNPFPLVLKLLAASGL